MLQAVEAVSASAANATENDMPAVEPGASVTRVAGAVVSTVTVTPALGGEAPPPPSTATTV